MVKSKDLKQELLDAALELFKEQGFEQTSVNTIAIKAGASKGAFYHYFKSKEEVLESITQQYINSILRITDKIVNEQGLNGLEKINLLVTELLKFKKESRDKRLTVIGIFEHEGNLKLKQKIIDRTILTIKQPYQKIIEQGVAEGIFFNDYPEEVAELWVSMVITMNIRIAKLLTDYQEQPAVMVEVKKKIYFYGEAMERILGLTKGAFKFSDIIIKHIAAVYMKN